MRSAINRFGGIFGAATLFALFSSAAIAQSISTNYVPGTDFSKLHSYRWVAVGGGASTDQIQDQQIKAAVDKALGAKSFTKKDADPVDFYVAYQVALDQEKELDAFGSPGWRFGGGMASVTTHTVDIGSLVLDVYDPTGKQLLWRGTASETVSRSGSPEKKQEKLDKAMAKLLKKFPPAAGK
jgi:hypothetical protein